MVSLFKAMVSLFKAMVSLFKGLTEFSFGSILFVVHLVEDGAHEVFELAVVVIWH